MAIRARTAPLLLPYTSEAFPTGVLSNGSAELSVSWNEILWAALTIGRPSVQHAFANGMPSVHEAIFRLSLVRMALEQHGPFARRLRRTGAFKCLDPTEKGAISYFLGMTFCKVFASRLLHTPWLLHLDVFKSIIPTSVLGRSRPDLIGQQAGSGDWLAFETKGRAGKPSATDRTKAKMQAMRLLSVNGASCTLHVGSFTFFANDALAFHWIDPPGEPRKPVELPDVGDAWRFYYAPARALWDASADSKVAVGDGQVGLPELDLAIKVHPLLEPFFLDGDFARAQSVMFEFEEVLKGDGFNPDGLKVECGPTWRERRDSQPRDTARDL